MSDLGRRRARISGDGARGVSRRAPHGDEKERVRAGVVAALSASVERGWGGCERCGARDALAGPWVRRR